MKSPFCVCCLCVFACGSCGADEIGSGTIETQIIPVSEFQALDVCCGWEVVVSPGTVSQVELTGDDNIISSISARSDGNSLNLYYVGDQNYFPTQPVRVVATTTQLIRFVATQGILGHVLDFRGESLEVISAGGSRVTMRNTRFSRLVLDIKGASEVSLEPDGAAEEVEAEVVDGSSYVSRVQTTTETLNVLGGSRAMVWVAEALDVQAAGASAVKYYGDPETTRNISSDSSMVRLGDRP